MRIGLFSDTYPPYINGVSTSILMLKNALEKAGHQVFVVTVNNELTKYKYEENGRIIRIPGVPTGIYDYRLTGVYPISCVNKIKKWKLDIIHSHTEFGVGTFARIFAKQNHIPLVHTYHTMYEDYIHYITKGYFDGVTKKIVEYLTNFYCDKTLTELIVPTKKTYDFFKEKYKYERNIHIVPTGIEIDRFYKENSSDSINKRFRDKLGLNETDFVLTFVGRIAQEKNIEFLIDNHKDLVKKYDNIKLVIIGDGPDLENYKKKVIKYHLEDNIIFTGRVPWEDIPSYYQITNLFTTASITETQGLTVIEAMAASCAPVVINDESFTKTVIDDLNGKIFNSAKDYKRIIIDLYEDRTKLKKLGKQARLSSEEYSSKYFAARCLDVYRIAIENYKHKKKNLYETVISKIKGEKDE